MFVETATLSSFRPIVCRTWHHIGMFPDRLPRFHRAGPSTSPDKSAVRALKFELGGSYHRVGATVNFRSFGMEGMGGIPIPPYSHNVILSDRRGRRISFVDWNVVFQLIMNGALPDLLNVILSDRRARRISFAHWNAVFLLIVNGTGGSRTPRLTPQLRVDLRVRRSGVVPR
jgi:hypothetical protein